MMNKMAINTGKMISEKMTAHWSPASPWNISGQLLRWVAKFLLATGDHGFMVCESRQSKSWCVTLSFFGVYLKNSLSVTQWGEKMIEFHKKTMSEKKKDILIINDETMHNERIETQNRSAKVSIHKVKVMYSNMINIFSFLRNGVHPYLEAVAWSHCEEALSWTQS